MNSASTAWLIATLVVAVADWVVVQRRNAPAEYVLKPLTMLMLAGVVMTLDLEPGATRWWHLAAVLLSMAGDIFLMLPGDKDEFFLGGLTSFLLAHVAYIVGMAELDPHMPWLAVGAVAALAAIGLVGSRIAPAAKRKDVRLFIPVLCYMTVIGVMATVAIGTAIPFGVIGALLFCSSDSVLGWGRFIKEYPWTRMVIITTYHLGQIGLVLALAAR